MKFVRLVAALSAAAMLTACTSAPLATVSPTSLRPSQYAARPVSE